MSRQHVLAALIGLKLAALLALWGGAELAYRSQGEWRGVFVEGDVIPESEECDGETVQLTFGDGSIVSMRPQDKLDRQQVVVKRRGELGSSWNGRHFEWRHAMVYTTMAVAGVLGLLLIPALLVTLHRRTKSLRLPRALYLPEKTQ